MEQISLAFNEAAAAMIGQYGDTASDDDGGDMVVENAIRSFVIRRKSVLFCDTVNGVNGSANLYSRIETAWANGTEPYGDLKTVITE